MIRNSAYVILLGAASAALAADPSLLNLAMPDARVISGVNVSRTLASPFGQHVLSQMTADPNFEKFIAETGFDPRRDLTELLFASSDVKHSRGHGSGLVAARGTFDVNRILGKAKAEGATIMSFNGAEVITKGTEEGWIAFLDRGTAVAGNAELVKAAIARRNSPSSLDKTMAAKVSDLSSRNDAWLVSAIPVSEIAAHIPNEQMNGPMKGDVLKSIQQASGGVRFGVTVEIAGEAVTRSDKDAAALADVVRFLGSMVQMNRNDANAAVLASIVDSMVLSTDGNVFRLSVAIPESDIERLVPRHRARVKKAALVK